VQGDQARQSESDTHESDAPDFQQHSALPQAALQSLYPLKVATLEGSQVLSISLGASGMKAVVSVPVLEMLPSKRATKLAQLVV